VLAATNVDLAAAVAGGRFRQDLYFRLNVYELMVPPLRLRGSADIRELTRVLVRRAAERRRRAAPAMDEDVLRALVRHRWPGNVRELENTVEHMIVAAVDSERLMREHLPPRLAQDSIAPPRTAVPSPAELARALELADGRPGLAASALGLSRHQFYRLARRYGLTGSAGSP
jgi:transcriptional regulator of acetoin/glycerol metabolism